MERELNGWKNVKVNIYWTNKHIDKNHIGNKSNTRNKNICKQGDKHLKQKIDRQTEKKHNS